MMGPTQCDEVKCLFLPTDSSISLKCLSVLYELIMNEKLSTALTKKSFLGAFNVKILLEKHAGQLFSQHNT